MEAETGVVGNTGATAGPNKTVALADFVGSAALVAVIVTCVSVPTVPGAVYKPPAIVPRLGSNDHFTC